MPLAKPHHSEFDLIHRYFSRPVPANVLGGGDDCALLPIAAGQQLAISTDTLIEGRHFLPESNPLHLGHKALAVNLSDLAAMGAQPVGCLLALSVPNIDPAWLEGFSQGFYALAEQAQCPLVGGDTTRNPKQIAITVTVCGQLVAEQALRRDAAQIGDDIWLTGQLGAAYIALQLLNKVLPADAQMLAATRGALERPEPPLLFAQQLPGLAHAAIDVSDGLVQDLKHVLAASNCGASLYYERLPLHPALVSLAKNWQQKALLSGGDVYQLCFTAAPKHRERLQQLAKQHNISLSRIGQIDSGSQLRIILPDGTLLHKHEAGFDHFDE